MNRIPRHVLRLGGLVFLLTAAGCVGEQRAWEDALQVDSPAVYESFVANFPESSFRELAIERMAALEEAAWESVLTLGTLEAFDQFLLRFPESARRSSMGDLSIDVQKAIEDRIIQEIVAGDLGTRFVIEGIEINADVEGGRFRVAPTYEGGGQFFLSTVYPDDSFPLERQFPRGSVFYARGSEIMNGLGLQHVHYADGTVWRLSGTMTHLLSRDDGPLQGYVVQGDRESPLSFFLLQGTGAVYLHGRGSIKTADGEVIFVVD